MTAITVVKIAPGAMHANFDPPLSAADIAVAGVHAGIEFDTASGPPVAIHEIALEGAAK